MDLILPQYILDIYQKFQEKGFQLYLVGGPVRNLLLNTPVNDWDLTTNATPEQMMEMFPDAFYDNQFGTVGIPIEATSVKREGESSDENNLTLDALRLSLAHEVVEITTFRSESEYKDHRHPEKVSWGKTLEEDLARRDFTINAMAIDLALSVKREGESSDENNLTLDALRFPLIDPYHGRHDLKNQLIRAVGNPNERFKEDALRMLRAIRFATQLEFTIEENTWKAVQTDAMLLPSISGERIRDELLKILASNHPYEGIMLLKNAGLLQYILPELLEGVGISQERPGRHHTADVFTHNVLSLKECPSTDPIVRFATLIHDSGKPRVRSADEQGLVIFYNHEVAGARIAYDIAGRMHFSKKEREKIVKLVRWHMFTIDEHITDSAVRRFIRRIGVENVKDMMDLRIGDRLGGGTQTAESWRLKLFKKRVEEQLAPGPFSIKDLAIDGTDIMQELNIQPGPQVGRILQKLFEEVDEDLSKNTREYLLERIKEFIVS